MRKAKHRRQTKSRRPHKRRRQMKRPRTIKPVVIRRSRRWRETHRRALAALAEMRRGTSLAAAVRHVRLKPETFRRHVGKAVRRRGAAGRFFAVSTDTLRRELHVLTEQGPVPVVVNDLKTARLLAEHANAVGHFYRRNDPSKLRKFEGKTIKVGGRKIAFLTDPAKLREVADGDALKLDSLYVDIG